MKNCSICFENITEEKLIKTDCNHCFHKKCMNEWLKIKNNCPLCRRKVNEEEEIELPNIQPLIRQQAIERIVENYERFTNLNILNTLFQNRLDRQNEEFRRHFSIE